MDNFLRPAREQTAALIRHTEPDQAPLVALSADELAVGVAALINGLAIERAFDPGAVPPDLAGRLLVALNEGARSGASSSGN